MLRSSRPILCLLTLLSALSADLSACSVPVFRYALEHWVADEYQALVFHRGPLDGDAPGLVERLRGKAGEPRPNLSVRTVDLDDPAAEEWLPVWKTLKADTLPWLVVRPDPRNGLHWLRESSPLNRASVDRLLDSPARREIVRRIGAGDSVVWLLLESGDAAADAAAAERLEKRLAYLGSVLKLPELSAADIANGLVSVGVEGLKLKFSSLRVARDDPAEAAFVRLLLGVESDLAELNQPMAFAIYGRGRALPPLVGAGIGEAMIDEEAIFLVGSCSCEVKEQNPGVDLLLTADWIGMLKRQARETPVAGAVKAAAEEIARPEMVTFSNASPVAVAPAAPGAGEGFDFAVPLLLLVLAAAAWSVRSR